MISKSHFLKSATSFCASLMMISTMVSSSHLALASSALDSHISAARVASSAVAAASAVFAVNRRGVPTPIGELSY